MLFFGQKCDGESVGQTGWQTGWQRIFHVLIQYFHISCQRHMSFTSVLLVGPVTLLCGLKCGTFNEWRMCLAVRLWTPSDRHTSGFPIHKDAGSPLLWPWYFLRRRIRAWAKLSAPSPHLSHRQWGGVSAHDSCTGMAVWIGKHSLPGGKGRYFLSSG